jgi:hypothetical protein
VFDGGFGYEGNGLKRRRWIEGAAEVRESGRRQLRLGFFEGESVRLSE